MNEKRTSAGLNFGARGWAVILFCTLMSFCVASLTQTFNCIGTYYNTNYGWDNTALQSILSTAGTLTAFSTFIISGLSLKISARKVAIALMCVYPVLYFCLGIISNFLLYAIVMVAARIVIKAASHYNPIFVGNWFPRKRGVVNGIYTIGIPLSSIGSVILIQAGLDAAGIVGAYVPFTILTLVCLALLVFVVRDTPEECGCYPDNDKNAPPLPVSKDAGSPVWTWKTLFRTKEFWLTALSMSCMLTYTGFMPQIGNVLLTVGFDMRNFKLVMTLISAGACVGSYICGVLDTKLGTKAAIIVTNVMLFALGLLAQTGSLVVICIALTLFSIVMGGSANYLNSLVVGLWGRQNVRRVFRYSIFICDLLPAATPGLIAALAQTTGSYKLCFLLCSVFAVLSTLLILPVKEGAVQKKEAELLAQQR